MVGFQGKVNSNQGWPPENLS